MKKKLTLVASLAVATVLGWSAHLPSSQARTNGKEQTQRRLRVEPKVIQEFLQSNRQAPQTTQESSVDTSCLAEFADSLVKRTKAIECYTQLIAAGAGDRVFASVFAHKLARVESLKSFSQDQTYPSILLLSYLEDVLRQSRASRGEVSDMYLLAEPKGQRVWTFSSKKLQDFDFEDGDVVLSMGTRSVSALIPSVTFPQRRFSHAFMIRRRDGGRAIMESLIETGVKFTPFKKFFKEAHHHVAVLRFRNRLDQIGGAKITAAQRGKIITRASDFAFEYAQKKVRYDGEMDMANDERIFCSELIVLSYLRAFNEVLGLTLTPKDIMPGHARIKTPAVKDFLSNFGVTRDEMPSPGDLMASPIFELIADYRPTAYLSELWIKLLITDLFLERVNRGEVLQDKKVMTSFVVKLFGGTIAGLKRHFTRHLGIEMGMIPEVFSGSQLAFLAAYDSQVFSPVLKSYLEGANLTETPYLLTQHPIWVLRDQLEQVMAENPKVGRVLSQEAYKK